jgi:hypothetical protein
MQNLDNEEMLDYLMTSDFNEPLKREEFIFLLNKWKNYYRILHSRYMVKNDGNDQRIQKLERDKKLLENNIKNLKIKLADKQNQIDQFNNRKLTFKERLKGKIIK